MHLASVGPRSHECCVVQSSVNPTGIAHARFQLAGADHSHAVIDGFGAGRRGRRAWAGLLLRPSVDALGNAGLAIEAAAPSLGRGPDERVSEARDGVGETSAVSKRKTASCSVTKTWCRLSPTDSGSKGGPCSMRLRAFSNEPFRNGTMTTTCPVSSARWDRSAPSKSANSVRMPGPGALIGTVRPSASSTINAGRPPMRSCWAAADTDASQLVARY